MSIGIFLGAPGGKGLPARKADNFTVTSEPIVQKIWDPRHLTTLWPSMACYRDSFTIVLYSKKIENTTFRKQDLFPSSGEGGGTYSVGSLRKREPQF
jgi:hypothetical protein